jgi:carbonic anhydrase
MPISDLIEGNRVFQQIGFKEHQEEFERLVNDG